MKTADDSNDKPDDGPDEGGDDGGDDNPPPDGPNGTAPVEEAIDEPDIPKEDTVDENKEPHNELDLESFQEKSDNIKSDEYVENGGEDVSFLNKLKNIMVEPDEDDFDDEDFDEFEEVKNKKSDKKSGIKGWDDDTSPENDEPKEINIDSEPVIERKTAFDDAALKAETEKKLFKDEPKKVESDKKSGSFFQRFSKKKAKESIFTDEDLNINQEERRRKAKRLAQEAEKRIESEREHLKKIASHSKLVKENEKQSKKKVSKIDAADPKALELEYKRLREEARLENEKMEKNIKSAEVQNSIDMDSKKVDKNSRAKELKDISVKNLSESSKEANKKAPVKTETKDTKQEFDSVSNVRVPKSTDETMNFEKVRESSQKEVSKEKRKESEINPNHIIREVETEAQKQARLAAEEFDRMMAERRKNRTSDKSIIDMKLNEEEEKLQKLADLFTGENDNQ